MFLTLHRKPYFPFPDVLKRWSFQKNCAGIRSFLYCRERWYFILPKIWSYTLNWKWKMIFLKNTRKYDISFKRSETMVFPKTTPPANDLSCIIWKDGIFFPENIYFPWAESERRPFSGNTWKYDALPSIKEKLETYYIGLTFDFFLNLFGWRYSTMNNLQYFAPFSP